MTGVLVTVVLAVFIIAWAVGGVNRRCPHCGKMRRSGHAICHHCGRG
jgi:hypothetical protein